MIATTPSGHLDFGNRPQAQHQQHQQQPTSTSDRPSEDRLIPAHPRNVPPQGQASAAVAQASSGAPSLSITDQSRVSSRSHSSLDLHDLHGHATTTTTNAPSEFSTAGLSVSGVHLPIDWSLYGGAHASIPLNQSPFDFGQLPHQGHNPPADPTLAYGSELVSPGSFHEPNGQYGFGVSWDDGMGPESRTPTVTTPAAVSMSTNPWIDPFEVQNDEDTTPGNRSKRTGRQKRPKRNPKKTDETQAGPSTEPVSPSSASQNSRASIGSKSASMASTVSTVSSRASKLRSASRTSKNNANKPTDTPEDRRTRASHNLVEKQYRNRLNSQFESLLGALPEQIRNGGDDGESEGPMDFGDRRVSKGEVLEMARKHIQSLERERDQLEREKNDLLGNLHHLKRSVSAGTPSSGEGQGTEIDFNISMDDAEDEEDGEEEKKDSRRKNSRQGET
ncbi:hypothetical protein G7046_g6602 [Stylonectria norvegica]|nr:hypothetical protein G7046_g6602 [Stylonectria norvegica]